MGDDEPDHADIIEDLEVRLENPEDECKCGSERCQQLKLSQELDIILDPSITYRSPCQLERIWPLLTNRAMEVSSFLTLLGEYQAERHCGIAWLQDFVAYRCRTCSDSPNMAICPDCFKNSDHQGHDYNMFKSSSGGACDCGYEIVKESGHCSRHGRNATAKRANETIPESLICVPRRMIPRLIHRLAIQLRKSSADIDIYLDCLTQLANSCAVLRNLMIEALISREVYSSQIHVLSNQVGNKQSSKIFKDGLKYLEHEQKCLRPFNIPREWRPPTKEINAFCDNLAITCFVDELVFWLIVYELPEKLVCFLLGLLMDEQYRRIFARSFVRNYPRILLTLIGIRVNRHLTRESYDKLSRRILHLSVQLYCHPNLTRELCDEEYVLHTIIYCLRAAIEGTSSDSGVLEPNRLCPPTRQMPMVVNTEAPLIRDRHLRSFTSDLYNILACKNEVLRLLNDSNLLNTWLEMLSNFQTMYPHKRELNEHTPYENGPHMSVFAVEADFCHSTMWSLLSCLKEKTTINSSRSLLSALHTNLARWFYIMNIGPNSKLDPYHMSFHIPLHRMFASTLRNMMFIQKVSDQDLHKFISCNQALLGTQYSYRSASGIKTPIPFSGFVQMLLLHPLQALTLYNEIRNNMWTRNGISIINQAITYVHCACSFSTVDLDMFLLKYSASKLNPNYFIRTLMTRFHAWKWLSFKSNILMSDSTEEVRQLYHFNILPEQVILMIESSLVTLIQLLTLSIYCNVSEKEQTRQEMVALISVIDRSYSYLLDMLPDRGVTNFGSADQNFVALLDELTIYKPAQHGSSGNLQQGYYTLKPSIWDLEYNPIQVLYRFYQKRDYQMSLERYFQHAKLTGKLDRRYHPSTLWPPLKIPRNLGVVLPHLNLNPLFECQALVGLVFTIIHKNLYYADVPDSIMAYTIHLLELSLRTCLASDIKSNQKPTIDPSFNGRYSMKELSSCPAYFGSRDESNIKGNTIFSVPDTGSGETDDDRLFPVVKNALDLAFETTWFPFCSVLENCLVHIENVHLLPPREFEALLESQQDPESKPDEATHTGKVARAGGGTEQAQSSDAEMYWSEQEYDESGIEEMIDDIDPDEDEEEEDEDDDDDDDDDDVADDEDDLGGPGENIADDGPLRDFELEIRDFVRARPITHERGDIIFRLRSSNSDSRGESNTIGLVGGEQQNRSTAANQQQTTGVRSSMESPLIVTESLPEFQSSALSLIPVRGHDIGHDGSTSNATSNGNNNSSGSAQLQIYPENLMTQRRALEAPEAVPMLEDSPQPLALEGPRELASEPAGASSGSTAQSLQVGGVNSNRREERSLSEMDIHARFVGFFQPRQESLSRSHLRGLRPRQTARRGGYRGPAPMTPLAVHNPAGSNISHSAAVVAPPPPPAYVMHPVDHGAGADGNNNNNNNSTANENEALQPPSVGVRSRGRSDDGGGGGGSGQQHSALRPATTTMAPTAAARGTTDPRPRRATQCSCALLNRALSARLHPDLHQRRLRRDRMHHGESLLSLLLRLHAKYSNRANSYEYNEHRAEANLSPDRTRVGDGVHFVAIVLDLICHSNQRMLARVGQLQRLIWASSNETATGGGVGGRSDATAGGASCETTKMQLAGVEEEEEGAHTHRHRPRHRLRQAGGGSQSGEEGGQLGGSSGASAKPAEGYLAGSGGGNCGVGAEANQGSESGSSKVIPSASLDPSERRRRAKEFQGKLMAEFASRQRAFMEKYESSSSSTSRADDGSGAPGSGVGAGGKSDKIDLEPDEEPINLSSKLSSETRPQMSEQDKQQRQRIASTSEAAAGSVGATKARRKQELTPADNSAHSSRFASANDQRASSSTSGGCRSGSNKASAEQEEPTYECCICGSDSSSTDLTNPLGQVVLLQATSVYGHAHLRPRHERTLPCDDVEQLELQEETYAKYLGRRIDLMCEYFCESSRLDTINIGAEGGVHVQSCGHYLHIECHQSYIKSLDQEDRPHARQYTDGFLCPVCRQLANSVLPMLGARRQSSSSVFSSSSSSGHHVHPSMQPSAATKSRCEPSSSSSTSTATDQSDDDPCACGDNGGVVALTLEQQIKLIGSLLEHRSQPNQRELQSSASFCQHLTKATEYRRVKSEPNMHSLFLFLTSIARTNLETEVIMRSTRYGRASSNSGISSGRASCMTPEVGGGAASRSASTTTTTPPSTKTPPTTTTTTDGTENGAPGRQRSCFLLLFQVLALNSRTLIEDHWFTYDQLWAHLTHQADEKNRLSVKPTKRSEVPLLLRDPTAMLLQFLFAITDPKHLSYQATHFTCLVQMLFNLTVIQSIALVLSYIRPQDKARLGLLNSQQQQPPHQRQQQQQPQAQPEPQQQTSCLFATSAVQATEAGEPSYGLRHVGAFESSPLSANSSSSYDTQAIRFARQASSLETSPRKEATSAAAPPSSSPNQFSYLLASVLSGLSSLLLPTNEEPLLDQRVRARWSNELLMDGLSLEAALALAENRTKLACLPFLRAAALIRHHLYGQPLPDLAESLDDRLLCEPAAIEADFAKLASYLQLVGTHSAPPPAAATTAPPATTTAATATELVVSRRRLVDALNWPPGAQESLVSSWSAELLRFGAEFSMAARSLLVCRPLAWHRPSLMKLPDSFDDIFLFYYRKECSLCHQIPKDVAVCLVCGAPVCFRNGCCKARSGSRQLHSHHCGAGTAIFLAIQTTSIVVIRGSRACVWGSVYLDAHDEEDSGLQRGKPLHLVQARYRLLEDQWLRHTFDHTCGKRWIYLQEN